MHVSSSIQVSAASGPAHRLHLHAAVSPGPERQSARIQGLDGLEHDCHSQDRRKVLLRRGVEKIRFRESSPGRVQHPRTVRVYWSFKCALRVRCGVLGGAIVSMSVGGVPDTGRATQMMAHASALIPTSVPTAPRTPTFRLSTPPIQRYWTRSTAPPPSPSKAAASGARTARPGSGWATP